MGRPDGRRPLPTCEIGRPVPGVDGGRTPGHAWHPVVPCVTLRRNIAGFTAVALRTARWSSPGPVAVDGSTGLPACLGAGLPLIRHCDELILCSVVRLVCGSVTLSGRPAALRSGAGTIGDRRRFGIWRRFLASSSLTLPAATGPYVT